MEVDENVPETLSWPDGCPHINFPSVLNWIIKSVMKSSERKGDHILVACKLAFPRGADQAAEVEISVLGDAVGIAPEDIERIDKAGSDLDWLETTAFPSCLLDPSAPDHPGHMNCLASREFSLAVYSLITGGGHLRVEKVGQETRAIFAFPWSSSVPITNLEDVRSSLSSYSGRKIILAIRSYDLADEAAPTNILADLGFDVLHVRHECELYRMKGTTTERVKAVITNSPDLAEAIRNLPHFENQPIILLLQRKNVTRLNMRWCMKRHICAILCDPLSHQSTAEALQVALCGWFPGMFQLDDPSPPRDILLAEDNTVHQKIITKMLERLEHRVDIVENGFLAVDAVVDGWYREQPYDLILMDTYMPFMNGFHAMAEIRRFEEEQGFTPTPIVVLTAEGIKQCQAEWARISDDRLVSVLHCLSNQFK
ncbi:hypothetical protein FRC01_005641 [Tulasnella sp. 417]|nr:hypothetical protein FRC01_005641 [Tulasnella sp. 417]